MTARTKIDVHAVTLSMEFGDTLVQFNIFEAMKHPTEDHSLFGIDLIDELVEECLQLDSSGSITEEVNYDELWEVQNLSDSKDDNIDLSNLSQEAELLKLVDQVCKHEDLECSNNAEVQVAETKKLFSAQVAMMFTTEYESAKRRHDREKIEVNMVKKTSVEVDLIVHTRAETNSANKDQKQARAKSISDNQVQNHVPSGFDSSVRKNTEFDPNPTRADSISVNRSRPQH
ncbi:hypothetical protein CR513_08282, partial [Mucuna pruriens]